MTTEPTTEDLAWLTKWCETAPPERPGQRVWRLTPPPGTDGARAIYIATPSRTRDAALELGKPPADDTLWTAWVSGLAHGATLGCDVQGALAALRRFVESRPQPDELTLMLDAAKRTIDEYLPGPKVLAPTLETTMSAVTRSDVHETLWVATVPGLTTIGVPAPSLPGAPPPSRPKTHELRGEATLLYRTDKPTYILKFATGSDKVIVALTADDVDLLRKLLAGPSTTCPQV